VRNAIDDDAVTIAEKVGTGYASRLRHPSCPRNFVPASVG